MLKLILRSKCFNIPASFENLEDINQDIYNILISTKKYEVKSNVDEEVFKSFLNNWLYNETPNIFSNNISQYQQLVQEFDRMNSVVLLYQKLHKQKLNHSLITQNIKSKMKYNSKKEELTQKEQTYRDIIFNLLQDDNINDESRFYEIYTNLFQACKTEDTKQVYLLTRKIVKKGNCIFTINSQNKTATLFQYNGEKTEIFIPRSIEYESEEYVIKSINSFCFDFSQIESIQFSETSEIQTIEEGALSGCPLKKISIPPTVTDLRKMFYFVTDLAEIKMTNNENFILYENKFVLGKTCPENDEFDVLLFARRDIEVAEIPAFIRIIGRDAFSYCLNIQKVIFPDNSKLVLIEEDAFQNCSLKSITIPSSVCEIKKNAFSHCFYLSNITFSIDSKLRTIEKDFFTASSIESFTIPPNVERIKHFHSIHLKHFNFMSNNNHFVFYNDTFLLGKSDLESDVYDVLIYSRKDVESVIIPSFVTKITSSAFRNCDNLKSVEFEPDSKLKVIGKNAFFCCQLKSISIPCSVVKIKENAFYGNEQLESFQIPSDSKLRFIGKSAFSNTSIKEMFTIPKECILEEGWLYKLNSLKNFNKPPIGYKIFDDKYLLKKSDPKSDIFDVIVMAKSDIDVAVIPSFIKQIGPFAFSGHKKLKAVIFPSDSKLEIIDDNAFSHSSIKSITIPSKVIRIGNDTFDFCLNLKSVEFSLNSNLRIIEQRSFLNTSIKKFSIPSSVAIIGEAAFAQCDFLKEFVIPKKSKLKMIDRYSFNLTPVASIFVPSQVSHICDFAFISTRLQIIEIADKAMLKSISDRVFIDSPLEVIMVPAKLAVKFEITNDLNL